MRYKPSNAVIVRGATAPFTLTIDTEEDLSSWMVTFTLRTEITSTGSPLVTFNSEDSRMTVTENVVGVTLTPTDTFLIPENLEQVYIQVQMEKDGVIDQTWIYSVAVAQTLTREATE